MQSGAEINVVAHVIQQAVAPVFLLTGVGAILGVLTNRLSRIIDRFRTLESTGPGSHATVYAEHSLETAHRRQEMTVLNRRRTWIHRALSLIHI